MRKILIQSLIIITAFFFAKGNVFAETNLRNYKPIQLAKGSFLKAINQRDISSSTAKVGDIEYFINPCDIFVGTSNIIPKDSVYIGQVEEILSEVEGINASMKIRIYKVITPERSEFPINASIYQNGSTKIGGELAEVAYYTRMPHYSGNWKRGTLQLVPTSIRSQGKPVYLRAGDEVTFVINDEHSLYKPQE